MVLCAHPTLTSPLQAPPAAALLGIWLLSSALTFYSLSLCHLDWLASASYSNLSNVSVTYPLLSLYKPLSFLLSSERFAEFSFQVYFLLFGLTLAVLCWLPINSPFQLTPHHCCLPLLAHPVLISLWGCHKNTEPPSPYTWSLVGSRTNGKEWSLPPNLRHLFC